MKNSILVLDFGGQYKELIARNVRSLGVYSEIAPGDISLDKIRAAAPAGIILTGGPASVSAQNAPLCDPGLFDLGIPILGICYGMQMMCHILGGETARGESGEYGVFAADFNRAAVLFGGLNSGDVLMSHTDRVIRLPQGFEPTATTADCPIAACENPARRLFGVQFHPESAHTAAGRDIIGKFLFEICGVSGDYQLEGYLDSQIMDIRKKVRDKKVLLGLSGGIDSSVCAAILARAIPGQVVCVFVDHGFMRMDEGDEIEAVFGKMPMQFIRVNAQDRFVGGLAGIIDPEAKRKFIGNEFIRVFEEEAKKLGGIAFLAQGTIYPDIVESGFGHGAVIKSHHNVGGLPDVLDFDGIIEPLAGLFKDEVRNLGELLGLPAAMTRRQPFPGPGLAIRIIGEVTHQKLDTLRRADAILRAELDTLDPPPSQYFAVMTNTYTVGVKGDDRTYDPVIALRAVNTDDFMTCNYTPLPHPLLSRLSTRITAEIPTISRIVYDITSKPPSTIEWE